VAHEAGWVTAEVGRQPWLIYGLMKTVQGVSPVVSVGEIWFSFLVLGILYAVLFVFFLLFALRLVRRGVTSG
jgi:cytochrome d ubiquinol oxidase subunit I